MCHQQFSKSSIRTIKKAVTLNVYGLLFANRADEVSAFFSYRIGKRQQPLDFVIPYNCITADFDITLGFAFIANLNQGWGLITLTCSNSYCPPRTGHT